MLELSQTLWLLVEVLFLLVQQVAALVLQYSLVLAWLAYALWGINWSRACSILTQGGWAPAVLLLVLMALVWSQIAPRPYDFLGLVRVPNFWWQLGAVGILAALTLFCGWLQGLLHWQPAELSLEPPAPSHDNGHGHSHH